MSLNFVNLYQSSLFINSFCMILENKPNRNLKTIPYPALQMTLLTSSWAHIDVLGRDKNFQKKSHTQVIVESESSVRKMQKRVLFHYKKVKKGTPNLASPYVHSPFTIFLRKQIFGKNKSSRAASRSRTHF